MMARMCEPRLGILIQGRIRNRGFGVRSEDDGLGPVLPSLLRRQNDEAVAVHIEHGDPGHHVLEAAVGLEPADAPAERLRQAMAVQRRRAGDQGAQQRHLFGGEVAAVIAALDGAGHPGAVTIASPSGLGRSPTAIPFAIASRPAAGLGAMAVRGSWFSNRYQFDAHFSYRPAPRCFAAHRRSIRAGSGRISSRQALACAALRCRTQQSPAGDDRRVREEGNR